MKKDIRAITEDVLKRNRNYVGEDEKLLKKRVISDASDMKPELLSLLLENQQTKEKFFTNVKGTLIFDKQRFIWFIEAEEFLPDSYTSYTQKIGLTTNRNFLSLSGDVVLDFPYKDCVLEGGQDKEDQKRKEIFYHEIIASDAIHRMEEPKVFTKATRYSMGGGGAIHNTYGYGQSYYQGK